MSLWYVYLFGETMGPLATDEVGLMLKQSRLQLTDYIWKDGLPKWVRVMELEEFSASLPPFPKAKIPAPETKSTAKKVTAEKPAEKPTEKKSVKSDSKVEKEKPQSKSEPAPIHKFVRVPISAVVVTEKGEKYRAVNIGPKGIFVKSPTAPALGSALTFRLESTAFEKPLEMTGVVTREGDVDKDHGFAIEFTRVNPQHKRIIECYVEEKDQENPK